MKPCSLFPVPSSLFPLPRSPRRGSALLIVLGMVSFMVISSVAFSFYMRASRQPSSYLRTAVSGRYLLKSALANAIARIDGKLNGSGAFEGVYDDYYPGLVTAGTNAGDERTCGNWWEDRVFCPFGQADGEDVVATLTLEGLAYLPPAIINEVRWKARKTKTAEWQNLAYEVGRYAFCAVDVSDCFDVNKLRALGRTSGGRGRVGFSSLFRKGDSWSEPNTDAMKAFNDEVSNLNIPFVSMADFNLYFGTKLKEFTPFYSYIEERHKGGNMQVLGKDDTLAHNALFITDTWFPPTNVTSSVRRYDLAAYQPFSEYGDNASVREMLVFARDTPGSFGLGFYQRLGGVGMACLYDYLDQDSVPISLCLPTVETAAMVCGVSAIPLGDGQGSLAMGVSADTDGQLKGKWESGFFTVSGSGDKVPLMNEITATPYVLDWGLRGMKLRALAAFPFKRAVDKEYKTKFKLQAYVRCYLGAEKMDCRLDAGSTSPLKSPEKEGDWTSTTPTLNDGILSFAVTLDDVDFSEDIVKQDDVNKVVKQVDSEPVDLEGKFPKQVVFWKVEKKVYTQNNQATPTTETYDSLDGVFANAAERPYFYSATGALDPWIASVTGDAGHYKGAMGKPNNGTWPVDQHPTKAADNGLLPVGAPVLAPHFAVWVRAVDTDGKTVDMVPAWCKDDENFLQKDIGGVEEAMGGERPTLLDFRGGTSFAYADDASGLLKLNGSVGMAWTSAYAVDLRFNYAPEVWCADASAAVTPEEWLNRVKGVLGGNGRDPDIFMFTSDQEYLQSMGELQFLPRVQELLADVSLWDGFDATTWREHYQLDAYAGKPLEAANNLALPLWETYSAFDGDPVYDLGGKMVVESGGSDFRVNPFTPDRRIFMAAIANTPYDWYVASTNEELNLLGNCDYRSGKPTVSDALKHAFNPQTACAKWTDEEVDQICDAVRLGIRAGAALWSGSIASRPGWEHYFDRLAWFSGKGDEQKTFMGVNLQNPLHGVDRKFLHGFWRECFQNRQQLFLIFVRAEPLTVGGSGRAALANTQLGARGVALVWRDPEPPQYQRASRPPRTGVTVGADIAPHRTRVLFYHQFD